MNRVRLEIDGAFVYDSGATPTPPNPPDPTPPNPNPPRPLPPGPYVAFELKFSGADRLYLQSGQVACSPLPNNIEAMRAATCSGKVIFGETPDSPKGATVEMCISNTPGLIDPSQPMFYRNVANSPYMEFEWLERMPPGFTQDTIRIYNIPYCPPADGPWYFNVRYTYPADRNPNPPKAFVNQWNYGGF